jgi:ATP-dependent Lon protease
MRDDTPLERPPQDDDEPQIESRNEPPTGEDEPNTRPATSDEVAPDVSRVPDGVADEVSVEAPDAPTIPLERPATVPASPVAEPTDPISIPPADEKSPDIGAELDDAGTTSEMPPVADEDTTEIHDGETPEGVQEKAPAEEKGEGEPEEPALVLPDELSILPLKDTVVYPFAMIPLGVGKDRSIRLIDDVMRGSRLVGLVAQKDDDVEDAGPDDCYRVGTVARIARLLRMPEGTLQIFVQGLERIAIDEFVAEEPYLRAKVHLLPETVEEGVEIEALQRNATDMFQRLVNLVQYLPDQLALAALNVEDPRQIVYLIASSAQLDLDLRQQLLELNSVREKLVKVTRFLTHELEVLELGKKIQSQAQEEMGKAQQEYFLREQMKAIQKELGEESEEAATVNELREKIEQAEMPEEAYKEAQRELSRLEKLPAASPEYSVIRTYLDLMISLPWSKSTGRSIDVPHARDVLDEDHYDLEKIKARILEYLAVRHLKEVRRAANDETAAMVANDPVNREPILCFVGPPGVGKTSLGHSIARALGREFVRMSLGGIHDEAEIRGHRRTYIGAMPGRILQSIRRAGTNDPVFMLDEVDKLASDWRGDPSSALLEVLDPEQNFSFRDNYLDLAFDLSRVMFIATANSLDPIPAPLRDRMEILELSGYTEEEKLHIARRYLLPKQITANGLTADEVTVPDETVSAIIRGYTREAGVRNLERELGSVCRKVARQVAEGQSGPITVAPDGLRELLGRPRFFEETAERLDRPGVVTGLVWTPVGGDIIFIEAAMMPSHENTLTLTGQLGDVMKESAMAALTYVRSNAESLGIDSTAFENRAFHIHVPEGAIPKDGPSAGVTMMTAIVSLVTGRRARSDVAMTGEISLRGKVLPIGGLKEKVLAAHRAGIRTVIFPRRNEYDLEDLPQEMRNEMHFFPVDDAREVLDIALEGGKARAAKPTPSDQRNPREPHVQDKPGLVVTQGESPRSVGVNPME